MINRRKFLEAGAAVGVGAMLPVKVAKAAEAASRAHATGFAAPGVSPGLAKFVDPLPIPIGPAFTYQPKATIQGVPYYEIGVSAFRQQLHRDLPATYLWGYGGTYPSRTIEAVVGRPIRVRWRNDLALPKNGKPGDPHPVASGIDRTNIDGANGGEPDQRIATHLHGGHVPWASDGGPKAWYTTGGSPITFDNFMPSPNPYDAGIKYFNGDTFNYPNKQPGTTLWFHDHAMGITRMNVIAGLAGFWLLRDPNEGLLNLPRAQVVNNVFYPYEIPLAIQDRTFNSDGSLFYPPPPEVPEFFGDTMLVNGKVWPFLEVEPRKYRFRILNGCNARFLRMQLIVQNTRPMIDVPFVQIGAEGGFLPNGPTPPFTQLLMAPAERADVIVDFSQLAGKEVLLFNDASTPLGNTVDTRGSIPEVMLFKVTKPKSAIPDQDYKTDFGTYVWLNDLPKEADAVRTVIKTLDEITAPSPPAPTPGMLKQLINQFGYEYDPYIGPKPGGWVKPDVAYLDTTEIWELYNTTVDVHPIHTHQTMFKVINRQVFNRNQFLHQRTPGQFLDPTPFLQQDSITPPAPNEAGFKDTVRANPGEVVRLAIKWEDLTKTGQISGHYVYHCHILEHEEHDMMRALDVLPAL